MRLPIVLLAVAACHGDDDHGSALRPDEIVTPIVAKASAEATEKRIAELDKKVKHDGDDSVVTTVATLGSGWTTLTISPGNIVDLWAAYADGNDVLVAGHNAWMARSSDGGASWKRVPPGPLGEVEPDDPYQLPPLIAKLWGSGDHLVAIGFENHLIAISADRGATWKKITTITLAETVTKAEKPVEPGDVWGAGKDVYITVPQGSLSDTSAIFASHDDGETWKKVWHMDGLIGRNDGLDAIAGTKDGSEVYVTGSEHGHAFLLRSRDHGATWQQTKIPAAASIPALAVAGPGELYASFRAPEKPDEYLRTHSLAHSRDGGASWTQTPVVFEGPPDEISGDKWWDTTGVFVGPDKTVYVAIDGRDTMQLESTHDGGKTWTLERSATIRAMAFANGSIYAVGSRADVHIKKP